MTTRRRILLALGAAAVAHPLLAQTRRKPVMIGYLTVSSREAGGPFLEAFKEGLAAHGWREGSGYVIEVRWANSEVARLKPLAEELAAKMPAIVVAAPDNAVRAAARAMPKVPVVQANGGDPVSTGLAASLARPGGMITGVTNLGQEVSAKSLELLVAAVPAVRRVGFLLASTGTSGARSREDAQRSAALHKIETRFAIATTPGEIEPAIAKLAKDGAQALVVLAGSFFPAERKRIVQAALKERWPVIAGLREFAEEGALLSYGADRSALYRRAAFHVDKILKGAKPGDLPFEQPTKFDFVVNMKTAKALGIAIPQEILLRADRVIE